MSLKWWIVYGAYAVGLESVMHNKYSNNTEYVQVNVKQ